MQHSQKQIVKIKFLLKETVSQEFLSLLLLLLKTVLGYCINENFPLHGLEAQLRLELESYPLA